MIVGFTGTRQGMSYRQATGVRRLLIYFLGNCDQLKAHHGDCLGADLEFHLILEGLGVKNIIVHPPSDDMWRAFCRGLVKEPLPYLERNREIVAASEILLATPLSMNEVARSGTWATVRHARIAGIPIYFIDRKGDAFNELDGRRMRIQR